MLNNPRNKSVGISKAWNQEEKKKFIGDKHETQFSNDNLVDFSFLPYIHLAYSISYSMCNISVCNIICGYWAQRRRKEGKTK